MRERGTLMNVTEDIRRAVRVELARRGWTQQDLARDAGVSEVHISRLLSRSADKSKRAGDLAESWSRIFGSLGLELVVKPRD